MAAKDPQTVAQKWATNLGASTPSIQAGVAAVTVAPGQAAAAQKQLWLAQITAAADKWATNVAGVSLGSWQQSMIEKGLPRIGQGAATAVPKMANFMSQFLPHVEQVAATVRRMPKGGLQNGINRAVAQIQGNAQFKYRKAG